MTMSLISHTAGRVARTEDRRKEDRRKKNHLSGRHDSDCIAEHGGCRTFQMEKHRQVPYAQPQRKNKETAQGTRNGRVIAASLPVYLGS